MDYQSFLAQLRLSCPRCNQDLAVAQEQMQSGTTSTQESSYSVCEMRDVVSDYLLGREECCPNPNCRRKIDWWKIIRERVKTDKGGCVGLLLAGAQITSVKFRLHPNRTAFLSFQRAGIPSDAKLLSLRYLLCLRFPMPRPVVPLEIWPGNKSEPIRREVPHSIGLYPWPAEADAFEGEDPEPTDWHAVVTWMPPNIASGTIASLATAFHALYEDRLPDVPIAAQVAVEKALREVLKSLLTTHLSMGATRDFLNGLTFNEQFNYLYPLILGLLRLPPLPREVRGGVNSLASARNTLAHGLDRPELSFKEMADGMTASLFAFKHISHVQKWAATIEVS